MTENVLVVFPSLSTKQNFQIIVSKQQENLNKGTGLQKQAYEGIFFFEI